jgi:hypothetical protein
MTHGHKQSVTDASKPNNYTEMMGYNVSVLNCLLQGDDSTKGYVTLTLCSRMTHIFIGRALGSLILLNNP